MLMHSLHTRSFFSVPFLQYSFLHSLIIAQYITFSPIIGACSGCSLSSKKNLSNFFLKQDNFSNMFKDILQNCLFKDRLQNWIKTLWVQQQPINRIRNIPSPITVSTFLGLSDCTKPFKYWGTFDFRLSHNEPLGWQKHGGSDITG